MSIATEVVYQDGVTAVSAAWLNLIQEHLAGWVNIELEVSGAILTLKGGPDDAAAVAYIDGELVYAEADKTFDFTGSGSNTYSVYLVDDVTPPAFSLAVATTPPVSPYVKVAEVDWDGSSVTDFRVENSLQQTDSHVHDGSDGTTAISHAGLIDLAVGDDHTQYMHIDGRRPFTATVVGVDPVAGSDLATKGFVDGLVSGSVPVGTVIPYGGSSAPSGWLLCDGTSYLVATYPSLAAVLNDAYGGDGGTNFNVPDLRGKFPYGKPDSGTGSTIGNSGGSLDHTHTQPTHTHSESAHTHTVAGHTHTSASTASGGDHTHTQSSTGSSGSHTHTGPSHTHSSSYTVGTMSTVTVGSRHASAATAGLFAEDDLDNTASVSSHTHGDGSLTTGSGTISGFSGSTSESHAHPPSANSKTHSHSSGALSGTTGSGGTGNTGSGGDHTHTNPTTGSSGAHTHTVGTTGSGLTSTQSNTPGTTGAGGGDATGGGNPPFQSVNYIIRT